MSGEGERKRAMVAKMHECDNEGRFREAGYLAYNS